MKGQCLCGSVTITTPDHERIDACHCGMCQRWGGGPLLSVNCGPQTQFEGTAHITTFKSSPWAERAFCAKCGTHLYYKLLTGDMYAIPVGLFQKHPPFRLEEEIFIDNKPAYYSFANETRKLTEAEVFAQYAPKT